MVAETGRVRGLAWRAILGGGAIALALCGCNRLTEPYVPPSEEPPAPANPVRIPDLAESRPSFEEVRGMVARQSPPPFAGPARSGPAAAAGGGEPIRGTLRLADEVSDPGSGVLFVIARTRPGPPLAVKRLEVRGFPVEFTLGPGDLMAGGAFAGAMSLTVRLDRDGNPMTRDPDDLVGIAEGRVEPGTTGIEIVLRRAGG